MSIFRSLSCKLFPLLFLLPPPFAAAAQIVAPQALDPAVRSLRAEIADNFGLPPVARLGSDQVIRISFDEISEAPSRFRVRFIHQNADRRKTDLLDHEFMRGFNDIQITDIARSTDTWTHYHNYRLDIPADGSMLTISGNYLAEIFNEDNPEQIIARVPFSLSEECALLSGSATTRTDRGADSRWQQIAFRAEMPQEALADPFTTLNAIIRRDIDNHEQKIGPPSARIQSGIEYSHRPDLIFDAGNEWRRFEITDIHTPGMSVDSIRNISGMPHAWIRVDKPRASSSYEPDHTQYGHYRTHRTGSSDPDISADYVITHFTLEMPEIPDAEIMLQGEFMLPYPDNAAVMAYNRALHAYTIDIPLKQGAYNYRYALRRRKSNPDPAPVEGLFHETSNQYNIMLFMRRPGSRADRLLGAITIISNP